MKLKLPLTLPFLFLILIPVAFAEPVCFESTVRVKDRSLEKIYIKLDKSRAKVTYLYKKQMIAANPFFCYQRSGYKECLGDDDSGKFILKNNQIKIRDLTIRSPNDTFHNIGASLMAFPVKKSPCKNAL